MTVKRTMKLLLSSMLVIGLLITAVGCGGQAANDNNDGQQGAEKPQLVVGTNATFPPFELQEDGELTGFDMELIRAIGEAQGYEVKIEHMDFKALIPAIKTGKIDAAIAGMSITPERLESVDFSDAYFDAGLIVAVRNDNQDINGPEDLKGKKLAGQTGTIGAAYCAAVKEEESSTEVRNYDDIGQAFMELEKGGIDAVVNDHPVTLNYIVTTDKANVKMVGEVFSADDQYGIAVKKGNQELVDMLNEGLAKIKEDGTYDKIYQQWIGE